MRMPSIPASARALRSCPEHEPAERKRPTDFHLHPGNRPESESRLPGNSTTRTDDQLRRVIPFLVPDPKVLLAVAENRKDVFIDVSLRLGSEVTFPSRIR